VSGRALGQDGEEPKTTAQFAWQELRDTVLEVVVVVAAQSAMHR